MRNDCPNGSKFAQSGHPENIGSNLGSTGAVGKFKVQNLAQSVFRFERMPSGMPDFSWYNIPKRDKYQIVIDP
jgi:hypothetical protein